MPARLTQLAAWLKRNPVFVITVLIPTALAVLYYGLIASDVYISESRFVVRSPQRPASGGIFGEILQGTGISHSQDDTYSIRDFILSRDALLELDQKLGVKNAFSSNTVDIINRFPGIGWDHSFEEFYRYYGKHVSVEYDPVSSITILTVRAFTAEDSSKINDLLVQMSERLVNKLNERSRQDLIRFSEEEVKTAAEKAKDASAALFAFRNQHSIFEPDKQAAIQLEGVAKIQEALISTEAELAQLQKLSPNNPQIGALESRADTLRKSMAAEASKVTNGSGSFSAKAPTFERLVLESTFADKQLGSALAALESARSEAVRKELYLERLVQPNLPDKAMEPRRVRSIISIILLSLIAWGVLSLLIASIREHLE